MRLASTVPVLNRPSAHCHVQAVVFEVKDRHMVGYASPNKYRYCCTKELVSKTKCHQDRLILQVHMHSCYEHHPAPSMQELARLSRQHLATPFVAAAARHFCLVAGPQAPKMGSLVIRPVWVATACLTLWLSACSKRMGGPRSRTSTSRTTRRQPRPGTRSSRWRRRACTTSGLSSATQTCREPPWRAPLSGRTPQVGLAV